MAAKEILAKLQEVAASDVAEAQSKESTLLTLGSEIDSELKAAVDAAWQEGKDSVILPEPGTGDKLFTQDDMDALAVQAKKEQAEEMQPVIDALTLQVADLTAQLEVSRARIESVKIGAIAAIQKLKVADDVLADTASDEVNAL